MRPKIPELILEINQPDIEPAVQVIIQAAADLVDNAIVLVSIASPGNITFTESGNLRKDEAC